ncbi:hypothetical protein [Avibacterium paragallinarum]|uniref:hypothetical protein n=1 Tax=Avibacterium paragallinarum TaxID=728 RepID=UPI00397A6708
MKKLILLCLAFLSSFSMADGKYAPVTSSSNQGAKADLTLYDLFSLRLENLTAQLQDNIEKQKESEVNYQIILCNTKRDKIAKNKGQTKYLVCTEKDVSSN